MNIKNNKKEEFNNLMNNNDITMNIYKYEDDYLHILISIIEHLLYDLQFKKNIENRDKKNNLIYKIYKITELLY